MTSGVHRKNPSSGDAEKLFFAGSRLVGRAAGRNRYVRAGWKATRITLHSYRRIFHILFLEVTGLFFAFFGAMGTFAGIRSYRAWASGKIGPSRFALALAFASMFIWFAFTSFWRAWKKPQLAKS